MRSYSYFSSEAWRWSTIVRRHSFGGKTKTLVFLQVSIKEEQRRVKSWRFELRNDPSLAAPLLYQHCTLSVASSVFSWMSGGGGNTVGCLVPASLPLACHGARAGFGCGLVVDVHDNKKKNDLTAHSSTSSVGRAALTDISRFTKRSRSLTADGERSSSYLKIHH